AFLVDDDVDGHDAPEDHLVPDGEEHPETSATPDGEQPRLLARTRDEAEILRAARVLLVLVRHSTRAAKKPAYLCTERISSAPTGENYSPGLLTIQDRA